MREHERERKIEAAPTWIGRWHETHACIVQGQTFDRLFEHVVLRLIEWEKTGELQRKFLGMRMR